MVEMYPCSMSATGFPREAMFRKQILHVMPNGWSDMLLQVLFGFVYRVFFQLILDVAVHRLTFAERSEVVSHDAHFQCALVAVNRRTPGILRVVRMTPAPMLPDHLHVAEVKSCGLRVGNVGLAVGLNQNPAGG